MSQQFDHLKQTWETLGTEDAFWAVLSHEEKRGGGWKLDDFLKTGERDVANYSDLITRSADVKLPFEHVLDFGCGVGRLSRAWASRAGRVTGVDISPSMVAQGNSILANTPNARLITNQRPDLSCFKNHEFDLVFSLICLQHMPWPLAEGYLREFARICRPGGLVAFQLPTRSKHTSRIASFRKQVVDSLPLGLDQVYRRWRHGSATVFDMHFTPSPTVIRCASTAGLTLVHQEPDMAAGEGVEGAFYVFRKHAP